ncbi:hypothetical protein MVEN_02543100 [Mycena venus]|uniref:Uncharacterized protein n=1 Tax=Mycena venus TaxID=2733690 RepID=A0A8H6WUF3_9AGAR|nr:hypothetical protein MVEN_02543100 [Mycena venus]
MVTRTTRQPKLSQRFGCRESTPNTRHTLFFSGLPFNGKKDKGTFDIDVEQYTQLAKGGPITAFPASCSIIDSPRWPNPGSKPVPYPGKFVSASGYLVGVESREVMGSPYKQRFKMNVDNVVYLGSAPSGLANDPSTPATSSAAKRKAVAAFDGTPPWVKRHNNGAGPSSSPSS